MKLSPVLERMVLHWGEMGARWGINRTVAQIHALLYFSDHPLPADEIVAALGVARSHISNSLKELQNWGVVQVVHVMGDRRDHFQSLKDVWQMFEILLDERKRREIDPTLRALRETASQMAEPGAKSDPVLKGRVDELLKFFEDMDGFYHQVRALPRESRVKLVKLSSRLGSLLG